MKTETGIRCEECGHEFLAIPSIPICRLCGGIIRISRAAIDDLPDEDDKDGDESDRDY